MRVLTEPVPHIDPLPMAMTLARPKVAHRGGKKCALPAGAAPSGLLVRSHRRKETARAGRVIIHKISAGERVTDEDMRHALET